MTREEAIKMLRGMKADNLNLNDLYTRDKYEALVMAIKALEQEPKTGRWIPVDSYSAFGGDEATWMAHGNPVAFYYCSGCKEQAYAGENGKSLLTDYCPNCGAKMAESEENK